MFAEAQTVCRTQNPDITRRARRGAAGNLQGVAGRGRARRVGQSEARPGRAGMVQGGGERSGQDTKLCIRLPNRKNKQKSWTTLRKNECIKSYANRTGEHDKRLTTGSQAIDNRFITTGALRPGC